VPGGAPHAGAAAGAAPVLTAQEAADFLTCYLPTEADVKAVLAQRKDQPWQQM
jgi:hypothetical protein